MSIDGNLFTCRIASIESKIEKWHRGPTIIDTITLSSLIGLADGSIRKRRHAVLSSPGDPVQRLVCAIVPGSYSRPHRFAVQQSIAVLRGDAWFITWNTSGEPLRPRRLFAGDVVDLLAPAPFHSIVVNEPTVILETLVGPYPTPDTRRENLDGWPEELDAGACGPQGALHAISLAVRSLRAAADAEAARRT